MSEAGVKQAVSRIFSDPTFQKAFLANPQATLKKSQLDLSPSESSALSKITAKDLRVSVTRVGPGAAADVEVGVTAIKKFNPGGTWTDRVSTPI